jgi:hypothetical protein
MKAIVGGLVLLLLCGCGSKASIPMGYVSGTVTYQGKPLDHGTVVFMPEGSGTGVPAMAEIAPDGSFEMRLGAGQKGAPVGKFIVTVTCREKLTEKQAQAHDMSYVPKSLIPEKYSNGSQPGLRFEVKPGTNPPYNIALE